MKYRRALISELLICGIVILAFLAGCGGSAVSTGGGGPVPTINSILPASAVAGNAAGFTLTIYGRNFVAGSTIGQLLGQLVTMPLGVTKALA